MREFHALAINFINELVNSVIVDGVIHPFEQRDDLLQLLENHICNHSIRLGKSVYKQVSGIPQGYCI